MRRAGRRHLAGAAPILVLLASLPAAAAGPPAVPFTDVTAGAGVSFVHSRSAGGEKLLPETMGGGVAFFDYDGDGDPDLLFVDTTAGLGGEPDDDRPGLVLYRNDGGYFVDRTRQAGLEGVLDGQGVAVGDIDGDGLEDVYVTAVGPNRLLRNVGGRFEDATAAAGVTGNPEAWSTGAAFFDADGDGDLDLWVLSYVRWSRKIDAALDYRVEGIGRAYARPQSYDGVDPVLYLNDGRGRFTDATLASGILVHGAGGSPQAKALALGLADVDGDGRIDVLVANDTVRNFFFHNRGGGRFAEEGELDGLAYDPDGQATGAMGVDAGDLGDGRLSFVVGNYAEEPSSLYTADGDPRFFTDRATVAGLAGPTRKRLTFGVLLLDADLDGRLDLVQANGHVEPDIEKADPTERYRQPAQLFWNAGGEEPRLVELPAAAIGDLARPIAGRGAAYADLDGDGDLDLVLTQAEGAAVLLRNDQVTGHGWLRVRLEGRPPNPDAIGARVEITAASGHQRRRVMPTRSYLSQVELPVSFGLGDAGRVDELRVTWPNGRVEAWHDLAGNHRLVVVDAGGR